MNHVKTWWRRIALGFVFGATAAIGNVSALPFVAPGYTVSTFVSAIPNNGVVGPVGLTNTTGGKIMVGGYANGEVRVFSDVDGQVWTDGTAASTTYGASNIAGLANLGLSSFYAALQSSGAVLSIDSAGNTLSTIASGLTFATGIVANAATGKLYVSLPGIGIIVAIDISSPHAVTTFASVNGDGMSLSPLGDILYVADLSFDRILGLDTTTGATVFDSGFIPGDIDGTVLGSGSLLGHIFANTNDGTIIDVNLTTKSQTTIFSGGSRGDLVTVDSNNGTMLFTQTDSVLRLTAPRGGGFGPAVPEPATLALLGLGLAGLGFSRRRKA